MPLFPPSLPAGPAGIIYCMCLHEDFTDNDLNKYLNICPCSLWGYSKIIFPL